LTGQGLSGCLTQSLGMNMLELPFQINDDDDDFPYVALDIEAQSLMTRIDANVPIWCVSLSWYQDYDGFLTNDSSFSIISKCYQWSTDVAYLLNMMIENGVIFVIHNATYDVPSLRLKGVKLYPGTYVDTLLLGYLMQPDGLKNYSLEKWGERLGIEKLDYRQSLIDAGYLDVKTPKGKEYAIPFNPIMEEYATRDTEVTLTLWSYLNQESFKDEELFNAYYMIELPYQEVIIQMEMNGAPVDRDILKRLQEEVSQEITTLEKELTSLVHFAPDCVWKWNEETNRDEYFGKTVTFSAYVWDEDRKHFYKRNLTHLGKATSPKQRQTDPLKQSDHYKYIWEHCVLEDFEPKATHVAWYLMKEGWKPGKKEFTKEGKPCTSADVLKKVNLGGVKPQRVVEVCVKLNNLQKLLGTYIEPLLASSENDGRVHCNFLQCNTLTTRLSSSNPNLQNIDPRVKQAFVAPPGYIMAIADLDRIELVVLAYILESQYGDSRMADAIRAGKDLHQINADNWGVKRSVAKTVIFLLIYGGGPEKLALTAKCTVEQAEDIILAVYDNTPALLDYKEGVVSEATSVNCGVEQVYDEPNWLWQDIHDGSKVADGFIRLLGGQRAYVPDIFIEPIGREKWKYVAAQRALGNYKIQGTAASINKQLHLRTYLRGREKHLQPVLVVHDENMLYIPLSEATEALKTFLTTSMCDDTLLSSEDSTGHTRSVPITAEYHYGFDWLEAKDGTFCNLSNRERWVEYWNCHKEKETGTLVLDKG